MLKLFGWADTAGQGAPALAAKTYFTEAAGPDLPPADVSSHLAAGAGYVCLAPEIASSGGITAAFRGNPIWRTGEPRIVGAPNVAHAVIEAYRLHGPRFLELLHGSFAVAVLEPASRRALLAVDRMGIEPLAYALDDGALTFASSAEAVARAPGHTPRIRLQALLSYFFFHMIPSPETVFEGVRKIPPATVVTLENGVSSERTYWEPAFADRAGADFESLRKALHESIATGVRAARPDEATGAFLSGGLDSSTVAGFFAKQSSRRARTFSIGFGFEDYDELRYARIANARFGCEPTEYEVTADDIANLFASVARQYDEPFGNASALPTHCCARLAREHGITHLLAGDGGDEIFAGNKRYAEMLIFERYQWLPRAVRRGFMEPVLEALPGPLAVGPFRKARNYIAQANTPMPDRLENWNFLIRLGFDAMLAPQFASAVRREAPLEHMRSVFAGTSGELVNRMLHYDWRFTLADNDLRKVNQMCELAGVRVSYPMLHPDVIDVSIAVPAALKMHGTELRTFYKRAMADFLPHEIINKTKHGFGLPFGLWLERSPRLRELVDTNLEGLRTRNIVKPEFIERLRTLHGQDDARYYGVFVWTLSMLEQWFREHRLAP